LAAMGCRQRAELCQMRLSNATARAWSEIDQIALYRQ
jgi:hypothetical protein